jgi:hypothetical protein
VEAAVFPEILVNARYIMWSYMPEDCSLKNVKVVRLRFASITLTRDM